jgi:hypothetical protein
MKGKIIELLSNMVSLLKLPLLYSQIRWSMKKQYNFSKGEKGKFYIPENEIEFPVYLNENNRKYYSEHASEKKVAISKLINNILSRNKDLLNMVVSK